MGVIDGSGYPGVAEVVSPQNGVNSLIVSWGSFFRQDCVPVGSCT